MRCVTVATGLSAAAGLLAVTAGATPTPFTLEFQGSRVPNRDIGHPFGVGNEGPFSASAPLCASGRASDVKYEWTTRLARVSRRFACADGSGGVTVVVEDAREEPGGQGRWKIVAGTGEYERLRGQGVFKGVITGGDSPETFTFVSSWQGVVDFDDAAPSVRISRLTATKLRRSTGAYLVRLAFSAQDEIATNAVSYQVKVLSGAVEAASRKGETTAGTVPLSVRVRVPATARRVRIVITASDPVGNERAVTRSLRLR